ncbi:hypothetical protein SVIO_064670 [Streptomyces violaceusniger]|uniref:Uncharacterized protein n=1 Tax=Streptomyces violaceusniger TaxID=68280 RepID=A0A4D4L611_STRVO|nr:hypothetical protein SVIO_064670 [Streptomyces violaceusniger]
MKESRQKTAAHRTGRRSTRARARWIRESVIVWVAVTGAPEVPEDGGSMGRGESGPGGAVGAVAAAVAVGLGRPTIVRSG